MSTVKFKRRTAALFILFIFVFTAGIYAQGSGTKSSASKEKAKTTSAVQDNVKKGSFQRGPRFLDANNDGICDHSRDSNGDGIPNCQDSTYRRPMDGTGRKMGFGRGNGMGYRGGGANRRGN